jgi:hypothetical protein
MSRLPSPMDFNPLPIVQSVVAAFGVVCGVTC